MIQLSYALIMSVLMAFIPAHLWAAGFDRPIPQAQSATAEFWFLLASVVLVLSLVAVGWLVSKR